MDAQNEDVCCPYNDANNQAVVAGTGQANNSNQEERQYENIRRPDDNADDQSLGAAAIPKCRCTSERMNQVLFQPELSALIRLSRSFGTKSLR